MGLGGEGREGGQGMEGRGEVVEGINRGGGEGSQYRNGEVARGREGEGEETRGGQGRLSSISHSKPHTQLPREGTVPNLSARNRPWGSEVTALRKR